MSIAGEIAKQTRALIPRTWAALAGDDSQFYGEEVIQGRIDVAKELLFGEVVDPDDEVLLYHPLVIEYAAIQAAMAIISGPGVEHWAAQNVQHTSTGKNEQKSFADRTAKAWQLHDRLAVKAEAMWPDVEALIGPSPIKRRRRAIIGVADVGDDFNMVTPDPFTFERPFELPEVV